MVEPPIRRRSGWGDVFLLVSPPEGQLFLRKFLGKPLRRPSPLIIIGPDGAAKRRGEETKGEIKL